MAELKMKPVTSLEILLRSLIGGVGGYYFAVALSLFISVQSDGPRSLAVINGILINFAVHAAVFISAFSVKSPWRLLGILTASTGLMMAIVVSSNMVLADV